MKTRIQSLILPQRQYARNIVNRIMLETFTDIGAAINVAELEHPEARIRFDKPVCGLSGETLSMIASSNGILEELLEESPSSVRAKLLLEFLDASKLRIEALRVKYPKAFAKWSEEEDSMLKNLYENGTPWEELSKILGRAVGALKLRLQYLGYYLGTDSVTPRRAS